MESNKSKSKINQAQEIKQSSNRERDRERVIEKNDIKVTRNKKVLITN